MSVGRGVGYCRKAEGEWASGLRVWRPLRVGAMASKFVSPAGQATGCQYAATRVYSRAFQNLMRSRPVAVPAGWPVRLRGQAR